MRIVVIGAGYVGLSLATLLSAHTQVTLVDIDERKVELVNKRVSPLRDAYIERYFAERELDLTATLDASSAYEQADLAIVATPTNYDIKTGQLDVSLVNQVVDDVLAVRPDMPVVVKSTVGLGYTDSASERHEGSTVLFSPEFLREGHALEDNLHPSRIIVGIPQALRIDPKVRRTAASFVNLLAEASEEESVPTLIMDAREAESVKLFSNTYLAMRVAFFNELDSFAMERGLDARAIVRGVECDPRIGAYYNNPSFGYGGYCLPKDTKELLGLFEDVPQRMMSAIVEANDVRKELVVDHIASEAERVHASTVGIYLLAMKWGSDNARASAMTDVMLSLRERGVSLVLFDPSVAADEVFGVAVEHDLDAFKAGVDLIVANRVTEELDDVREKVFSRDIFRRD